MTLIQSWLRDHGPAFDVLLALYGIKHRRHQQHPNLVLFKYDQIASPFAEPIVRECRGIVLDEADGWRIVCRAFDKFFNHGEGHAAPIDWSTARVQEKLDGSLATLYRYADQWHVATTGTPDASGDVSGFGITFDKYFWQTFDAMGGVLPLIYESSDLCFSFELMGPINRIVVQHKEPSLRLLSVRNRVTGEQFAPDGLWAGRLGIPAVNAFPLQSFDDIAATFATMSPLAQEGYVVVDGAFNRVKVKHPGYVALHHAKGGMSRKAFVEIARSGETSEVIAAFPEFKPMLDSVKVDFEALMTEVEADYVKHQAIEVQKDFAIAIKGTRWPGALFAVRSKKAESVRGFARTCLIKGLLDLLGYRETEAPVVQEEA